MTGMSDDDLVAVPAVSAVQPDIAISRLSNADLTPGQTFLENSDAITTGFTIGSDPPEGTLVPRFGVVNLIVSSGHAPTGLVPNVAGLSFAEAQGILANEGYQAVETPQSSDFVDRGLVIGTVPGAGAELTPGAGFGVSVLVSTGPEPVEPPPPPPDVVTE